MEDRGCIGGTQCTRSRPPGEHSFIRNCTYQKVDTVVLHKNRTQFFKRTSEILYHFKGLLNFPKA